MPLPIVPPPHVPTVVVEGAIGTTGEGTLTGDDGATTG